MFFRKNAIIFAIFSINHIYTKMSSSSSIAAARRRRTGPPPTTTSSNTNNSQPQSTRNTSTPTTGQNSSVNPYVILQQHHVKINSMEQSLHNLITQYNNQPPVAVSNIGNTINMDSISETIMTRLESQFNLNVLYENDKNLSSDIDNLNKIIHDQQNTINSLNQTLYYIIQNLNIKPPSGAIDIHTNSNTESTHLKSNLETKNNKLPSNTVSDDNQNNMFPPSTPSE